MEPIDNKTMTKAMKIAKSSRDNSESIAAGLSVVLSWALETYTNVVVPTEVVAVVATMIGGFSVRVKERL